MAPLNSSINSNNERFVNPTRDCLNQAIVLCSSKQPCRRASDQKFSSPYHTKHACKKGRKGSCRPVQGEKTHGTGSHSRSSVTQRCRISCMYKIPWIPSCTIA